MAAAGAAVTTGLAAVPAAAVAPVVRGCLNIMALAKRQAGKRVEGEMKMQKYVCSVCGYVYDPAEGDPDHGVAAGTDWQQVQEDWVCPVCGVNKDQFNAE